MSKIALSSSRVKTLALAASLALVAVVGILDYVTGPEIAFSIFFLAPIALAAWHGGRPASLVVAVVSAVVWLAVDLAQPHYTKPWLPYWNAGVRLGFFVIIVILLSVWRASRGRLEETVAVRTAALTAETAEHQRAERELVASEERFRQAQKMEAIGRLAGGIAHDFRNQLTVIKGYCQLAMGQLQDAEAVRSCLEEVNLACQRATRLTGQLLAFSRRELLRPEVVNLNRVLSEVLGPLGKMIGEDVRLTFVPLDDLGNANVDVSLLQQTVMNLVVNARDAMPDGGKLTIETANVDLDDEYARQRVEVKPGSYVMLAVTDTGVGMTPEIQTHLFEPFFTTKQPGQGTGLGLSMVYGFVKQSGGHIAVYSEPGKGSAFKLYFPRTDAREAQAERLARQELPRNGTETVLVVEDEESIRKLVARQLSGRGYRVLTADSREAQEMVKGDDHIDLLLTDVVMPEIKGPELARQLRARLPKLKVLFMTGYARNAIVHHGIVDAGVALLVKPFSEEELAGTVRQILDDPQAV